ncbi:MAG: wax ester/triacylglycerol synthase domain-containing protein [Acidimicrobiales bacterium]
MRRRLNEVEVLLWQLGHHPLLSSTMGAVIELDHPPRRDDTVRVARHAAANVAGLRERVAEPLSPITGALTWEPDPDLDFDHHVRFVRLEANSPRRELHHLAAQILADPFDTSRPLWQITVVGGLRGGRGALVAKLHHAIADGQGALALAAHLFGFSADQPLPAEVDLEPLLHGAADAHGGVGEPPRSSRFGSGLLHRLNDAAGFVIDPRSVTGAGVEMVQTARRITDGGDRTRSPLWQRRSRNRRLHTIDLDLDALRDAARRHDTTLNGLFVSLAADAVVAHHERHGVEVPGVSASMVVSRRSDADGAEDNAVVPVPITVPGSGAELGDRLAAVAALTKTKAGAARGSVDVMGIAGGLVGYVPAALTGAVALGQTSQVDLATSNVPGPPVPIWFAGRRVRSFVPVGPLMGTAVNLTLLSYDGSAAVGVSVDPAAVDDHTGFAADLARSFQREVGGAVGRT